MSNNKIITNHQASYASSISLLTLYGSIGMLPLCYQGAKKALSRLGVHNKTSYLAAGITAALGQQIYSKWTQNKEKLFSSLEELEASRAKVGLQASQRLSFLSTGAGIYFFFKFSPQKGAKVPKGLFQRYLRPHLLYGALSYALPITTSFTLPLLLYKRDQAIKEKLFGSLGKP